jgi:hypothetical protein
MCDRKFIPKLPTCENSSGSQESEVHLRSCSNVNQRIFREGGRVYRTYLQVLRLLANPPLQLLDNGASSQVHRRCCAILKKPFMNRQDACSTRKFTFVERAGEPVIENGARGEVHRLPITDYRLPITDFRAYLIYLRKAIEISVNKIYAF